MGINWAEKGGTSLLAKWTTCREAQKKAKTISETASLVWLELRGKLHALSGTRKGRGLPCYLPPATWTFLWKAMGKPGESWESVCLWGMWSDLHFRKIFLAAVGTMDQKGSENGGRQKSWEAVEENEVKQGNRRMSRGAFALGGWDCGRRSLEWAAGWRVAHSLRWGTWRQKHIRIGVGKMRMRTAWEMVWLSSPGTSK